MSDITLSKRIHRVLLSLLTLFSLSGCRTVSASSLLDYPGKWACADMYVDSSGGRYQVITGWVIKNGEKIDVTFYGRNTAWSMFRPGTEFRSEGRVYGAFIKGDETHMDVRITRDFYMDGDELEYHNVDIRYTLYPVEE